MDKPTLASALDAIEQGNADMGELLTSVYGGALQIVAMLWLIWALPWTLIVLVMITHLGTIGRWLARDERRTHEGY